MTPAPRLADRCAGRDNNLNLIRMVAALTVMVSHAFPIARGPGADEPLVAATGHPLGLWAVAAFFTISGFLIARSFDQRRSTRAWLRARVLRLFPALLVVLALTVLVLGPLVTEDRSYFARAGTWTYLPRNLLLAPLQFDLPGVFGANPYPSAINGSLWTLFYEVLCYVGVLAAGTARLLRRPLGCAVALLATLPLLCAVQVLAPAGSPPALLAWLAVPFALGMLAWCLRQRVRLSLPLALLLSALAWLLSGSVLGTWALTVAIGYATFWLAYVPRGALLGYNRLGDYSYGTYIYAFPAQQLAMHLRPGVGWAEQLAWALPATLACAVLSWHLVERPALDRARPGGERRARFWQREGRGVLPQP